ncbi:MAG: quinone oxidoreductase [Variovorax sp.]|nr:MAG: quinone oxidoreductase [Variovorax sp.]
MRAIVVAEGDPQLAELPVPLPTPDQILVKVRAAALNRADLHVAAGHKHGASGGPGVVIGIEWAGEIAQIGAAVPAGFRLGDAVMCSGAGGYAEYAVADWGRVHAMPPGMDFRQAAALPVALQTSHEALANSGGLRRGESVLVQGASSGVGLMTMQVAKVLGAALVIGTSTTASRRSELGGFGADIAIDPSATDWPAQVQEATAGAGCDLVIDFVAGPTMNANMQAARVRGRIVNVGRMGGFRGEFDFDLHSLRRIQYIGVTFRTRSKEEVRAIASEMKRDLWDALAAGALRMPVSRSFALADAAAALDCTRGNAHFGKVVLDI